jgi:hypothetical protein
MLAALAYWGFAAASGVGAWALGLSAPALAAAVWGAFVAPKANWPVSTRVRLAIELVLFGSAAVGLGVAGQPVLAILLAVAASATSILNASSAPPRFDDLTRQQRLSDAAS